MEKVYLTLTEAANKYGMPASNIQYHGETNKFEMRKVDNKIKVEEKSFNTFLKNWKPIKRAKNKKKPSQVISIPLTQSLAKSSSDNSMVTVLLIPASKLSETLRALS